MASRWLLHLGHRCLRFRVHEHRNHSTRIRETAVRSNPDLSTVG